MSNLPTVELEAVNTMLQTIGEAPVSMLDSTGIPEVAFARATLHETNREVQSQGWHFNTERELELSPSVDGYIVLPANTLRVDETQEYETGERDVVQRSTKLYDIKNHTFIFTEPVKLDLITFLNFDELPEAARNYITIRAARKFGSRVMGSETVYQFTKEDEETAKMRLGQAEGETGDYNILTGHYDVFRIIDR